MILRHFSGLAVALLLLAPTMGSAHFLFIRIVPGKGDARKAEVYFSEGATAGDEQFIDKIAGTQLWTQTEPGKFRPLKVVKESDRLRADLPSDKSMAVVGICNYGVLARKTPFLLRHFPKAVTGSAKQLNAMKPFDKVPLEIIGRVKDGNLHLTVLREGKPLPGAEIRTVDKDLKGTTLKCAADGSTTWTPRAGWQMAYVGHFHKTKGEYKGRKHEEIRDFATFSFIWPMQ